MKIKEIYALCVKSVKFGGYSGGSPSPDAEDALKRMSEGLEFLAKVSHAEEKGLSAVVRLEVKKPMGG
jgi:hypothetical protein